MNIVGWVLLFSVIGGLLSMMVAVAYALLPQRVHVGTVRQLVSFATGALLAAAFIGLLPEALDARPEVSTNAIMATVLVGVLVFFLLEKTLIWRHAHDEDATDDHHIINLF